MTIVRTLIAVASSRKWKIFQLDVKNAFLNGDPNEEVFMKPPPGVSHKPGEVYQLRKALYGLKQAPRACQVLCVYFCRYMLMIRLLLEMIMLDNLVTLISIEYSKTILPKPESSLFSGYYGYFFTKRMSFVSVQEYSQFVLDPTTVHWAAFLHILRYLRGTQFQALLFPSTSALDLRAYCDSDWAGDSKKQDVLSKSSTEAEYRAMAVTTSEIVWLRWLLADMGVRISLSTPLHCDNRSAIQIS
nr:uncharacterized mitochondrial protein AtMg00810-like [Tanacetum cinerariifolium]